jgi:hypothetical protein
VLLPVLQALLATEEYRKAAAVTVVTFGSPAVGNKQWAENFDAKINARQLAYAGDGVAQVGSDAGCYPFGQRATYHMLLCCRHHLAQHVHATRTEPQAESFTLLIMLLMLAQGVFRMWFAMASVCRRPLPPCFL